MPPGGVARIQLLSMARSGKVSPIVVIGVLGVLGFLILLAFLQAADSPSVRVQKFFVGLAKGQVDQIMQVSKFGDEPEDVVRKKWEKCLYRTEYYRFFWKVRETVTPTPDEAIVFVEIYRGVDRGQPYEERYEVPVIRENGQWYVDAKSLDRRIHPALPR